MIAHHSLYTQTSTEPTFSRTPPDNGMVWIPGGTFLMGSDRHYPEEAPAHRVSVDGFWMDVELVTNEQFRTFAKETGYPTVAQRVPDAVQYPGARPEMLVPGSVVFRKPARLVDMGNHFNWWTWVPGANWRHPEGPGTWIGSRKKHPVVHMAAEDVEAYAEWAGKELPTEAEWELAARGGLDGFDFAWGDELTPGGKFMANTWQGKFPYENLCSDGYEGTSPVAAFPANAYGLYDMIGNVWEWTADWYQPHKEIPHTCCANSNPRGGVRDKSNDPSMPDVSIPRRVIKGGSYLCAENYCQRYRPAARMAQAIDSGTNHLGFRCIVRP